MQNLNEMWLMWGNFSYIEGAPSFTGGYLLVGPLPCFAKLPFPEPRDPKNPKQPLHCNFEFQMTLSGAFAKTNFGNNGGGKAEAGFGISKYGDISRLAYAIGEHLSVPAWPGNLTLAIVHTHGNSMDRQPSTDQQNGNTQGDVYSKVPNYVYSEKDGVPSLFVTDPSDNSASPPLDMGQSGCPAFSSGFSQNPSESYT